MLLIRIIVTGVCVVIFAGLVAILAFGVRGSYDAKKEYCIRTSCATKTVWIDGSNRNISEVTVELRRVNLVKSKTYYTRDSCSDVSPTHECYYYSPASRTPDRLEIVQVPNAEWSIFVMAFFVPIAVIAQTWISPRGGCQAKNSKQENRIFIPLAITLWTLNITLLVSMICGIIGLYDNTKDLCQASCSYELTTTNTGKLVNATNIMIKSNYINEFQDLVSLNHSYYDYDGHCPATVPCYYTKTDLDTKLIPNYLYFAAIVGLVLLTIAGFASHFIECTSPAPIEAYDLEMQQPN